MPTWNDITRTTEEEHQHFRRALNALLLREDELHLALDTGAMWERFMRAYEKVKTASFDSETERATTFTTTVTRPNIDTIKTVDSMKIENTQ